MLVIIDERHVPEFRIVPTERIIDHHLFRCVRDVIVPTQHVTDFHQMVVHNNGEVVSWHTILFTDNKVT